MSDSLQKIQSKIKENFKESKRILSFQEYFDLVKKNPLNFLRPCPQYISDSVQYYGQKKSSEKLQHVEDSYSLFDLKFLPHEQALIGQQHLQNEFVKILESFVRSGRIDKLIVLHGPNGSAKSTFIKNLFLAIEDYSKKSEGALFQFSWIFPLHNSEKKKLGIGNTAKEKISSQSSYAHLEQENIAAILRSELHENPIFLIPKEERELLWNQWKKDFKDEDSQRLLSTQEHFFKGELSHKNAIVLETLLEEYNGDIEEVWKHIRVERYFFSRKFRRGLVTIEAKLGMDAQMRQVTLDQSMRNLPPALQSLNLFQLEGDLIDGNRGIIEYSDLLKRPVEAFKYLLSTVETGSINLGHIVASLNSLLMATTNDRQLQGFREHPEFYSFKSRIHFIRVPYLLRFSEEAKIYDHEAEKAVTEKEKLPHTSRALALWAVMTRLKRPMLEDKKEPLKGILEKLKPLQKAKLYNDASCPEELSNKDQKILKAALPNLYKEHQDQVFYEGFLGASARELKTVLHLAAQNKQFNSLGPPAIFAELRKLVKKTQDFDYLRLEKDQEYFQFENYIQAVEEEWLNWVDEELRSCIEIHQPEETENVLRNYFTQVIACVKNEELKNPHTGKFEKASEQKMEDVEKHFNLKKSTPIKEYRESLVTRLGVWALENKSQKPVYSTVFPELEKALEKGIEKKKEVEIRKMAEELKKGFLWDDKTKASEETAKKMHFIYDEMQKKFSYGKIGAQEVLVELIKKRYT